MNLTEKTAVFLNYIWIDSLDTSKSFKAYKENIKYNKLETFLNCFITKINNIVDGHIHFTHKQINEIWTLWIKLINTIYDF